jgi:hypothetical protein
MCPCAPVSFFQPAAQDYPSNGQTVLPAQHGKTSSFFQESGVQQEFAYIPDDGSQTYVINVETNTTQVLAGPSSKDANSLYFAGVTSLVQIDSTGAISYLPYTEGDAATNAKAAWTAVSAISSVAPASSGGTSSTTGSASAAKTSSTSKPSSSGNSSSSSGNSSSAASGAFASASAPFGMLGALAGALALGLAAAL